MLGYIIGLLIAILVAILGYLTLPAPIEFVEVFVRDNRLVTYRTPSGAILFGIRAKKPVKVTIIIPGTDFLVNNRPCKGRCTVTVVDEAWVTAMKCEAPKVIIKAGLKTYTIWVVDRDV